MLSLVAGLVAAKEGVMQRILNYVNATLLLVVFGAPVPILMGIVPNYVALPEHGNLLWVISIIVALVVAACFLMGMRMNRQNPPPGYQPPGKVKAILIGAVTLVLLTVFVPGTVKGALPAYASYIWNAPQVVTLTVKDPRLSSSGRYSCDGGVEVVGQLFFSRICGVPEDLRSQMQPGNKIEVTGPGHALGLRVETVQILP
jgi:hypothetical protein